MISSKAKLTAKLIKRSRWTSFVKILLVCVLLWLCTYYYVSNFKSKVMNEANSEDSHLNMLQQKITDLIGNQFKNDANNRRYEEVINAVAQEGEVKVEQTFQLEDGITDEAKQFMKANLNKINYCKIIFQPFSTDSWTCEPRRERRSGRAASKSFRRHSETNQRCTRH